MNVTEQDLRDRYEALDTEELITLQAQGTLTETAARVLEQVLVDRGISAEQRAALALEIKRQAAAQVESMPLASPEVRLGAQLIDVFVVLVLSFLSTVIMMLAVFPLIALTFLLPLLYLLFSDGLPRGQSVGKRALHIAVIDQRSHRPCTYRQSFVRNLLLMLLGVIDCLFIFGRTRQRLGDHLARTIVVHLKPKESSPLNSA